MTWRREPKAVLKALPDERKALAERYTIDADEAQRREQLAAEEAAGRAAAEEAARLSAAAALEEELRRQKQAEAVASAEPAVQAAPQPATLTPRRRARMTLASFPGQRSAPEPETQAREVEPVSAEPEASIQEPAEETADLPIYRWFGNG